MRTHASGTSEIRSVASHISGILTGACVEQSFEFDELTKLLILLANYAIKSVILRLK